MVNVTEACGFHFSHTDRKSVYGHQVPDPHHPSYVHCDSWSRLRKIIHAALEKGHHHIGVLKNKRILYPQRDINNTQT